MAYKMNNSPAKLLWPWSKKAKRRREQKRNIRDFEKGTEIIGDKTVTREGYELVDGELVKISRREQKRRDAVADQKYRDKLSGLSDAELEAMR